MSTATLRLLEILEEVKKIDRPMRYIEGWAKVFKAENEDDVLRKIGLFYQLVHAAADEVLKIAPGQKKSVDHWKSRMMKALYSSGSDTGWQIFVGTFDDHTIEYLRLHSEIVALVTNNASIDLSLLGEAKKKLSEAIIEITDSNLSSASKIKLVNRIRSIVNAIEDFNITGDERVFDAFKATLFDLSKINETNHEIPGKSKIREGLSIISDLMSTADGAIALSGPVTKLLENFK